MAIDKAYLASNIKGVVLLPGDEGYNNSVARWASNTEKKAGVVVLAESADDVAVAIVFAKQNRLDIAVRGGGHSTFGASSTDGGILIDLRRMNKVSIDEDNQLIIAQGGALWKDVDREAAKYDLVTVGPTVNGVGVGGSTLGGGYGWLCGRYGLTVDNLKCATIVLSNGIVAKASEQENSDLFWAMRGGGPNFGVVTEFTFKAYPHVYRSWAGMLIFAPDKLHDLVEAYNEWAAKRSAKESLILAILSPPPDFKPTYVVVPFYDGPGTEGRKAFDRFFQIGPILDTTQERPYIELNEMVGNMEAANVRRFLQATAVRELTVPKLQLLFDHYCSWREKAGEESVQSGVLLQDYGQHKVGEIPEEHTAFANRGQGFVNLSIMPSWHATELDVTARAFVNELMDAVVQEEKRQLGEDAVAGVRGYFNGSNGSEPNEQVYRQNYKRLREIKRKYDPEMVFNKWYGIKPAD